MNGDNEYIGDGSVNVQFLSSLGVKESSYAYYGEDEYDDGLPAGWYDEMEDELAEYSFNAAEGFMVLASEACNFTFSGEVNMAETDVPFRKNLSAQGNIRPSAVGIQSIIPINSDEEYIGDGDINIQFLSPLGVKQFSYAYYGEDEYDDDMPAGWYDETSDELADYTFEAGEGFIVMAGSAGFLRFPEM